MSNDKMAEGIRAIKDTYLKWYVEEEERRSRNKKIRKLIVSILSPLLALATTVLLILNTVGDRILLSLHGFSTEPSAVLCSALAPDGSEYRIVCSNPYYEEQSALGVIKRNPYGFWEWVYSLEERDEHGLLIMEASLATGGTDHYYGSINLEHSEYEQHTIIAGSNAVAQIPDISIYLPEGVSAAVYQEGQVFLVHLITYKKRKYSFNYLPQNVDFREQVPVYEILKDLGCIG